MKCTLQTYVSSIPRTRKPPEPREPQRNRKPQKPLRNPETRNPARSRPRTRNGSKRNSEIYSLKDCPLEIHRHGRYITKSPCTRTCPRHLKASSDCLKPNYKSYARSCNTS